MSEVQVYDALFQPIQLGPVTAKNRINQMPHCTGFGHVRSRAEAAVRGRKAEGGWGVVSTQETEIHLTSDVAPCVEGRLRYARDIPALRLMTDADFDIVYVYTGHGMTLAQHFMLPHPKTRSDEYGGALENLVRLTRELLEDTRDAVGDSCAASDRLSIPIRRTQHPTIGEEWRRGWYPERIAERNHKAQTLVFGSGPAGMESATQLARRGYEITLAEGAAKFGGRVLRESRLPGLVSWCRVVDDRLGDLLPRAIVQMFTDSTLNADHVSVVGICFVFLATGSKWRKDGIGRNTRRNTPWIDPSAQIYSPDNLMRRIAPDRPVLVYDDDHIYFAGFLAKLLALAGQDVVFAMPESTVSGFSAYTLEQHLIQARV